MILADFSAQNLKRCQSPEGFNHTLSSWHPTQWTNAMAGECGEACNVTKKILRHDQNIRGNLKVEDASREALRLKAIKECADVIIYADLAIQAMGGDTTAVLRDVFNSKSREIGCSVTI